MITWRPIAELPDELKDGREVLLWTGTSPFVGVWVYDDRWQPEGMPTFVPTHFAEINVPEGAAA